jgi:hypothetical protein
MQTFAHELDSGKLFSDGTADSAALPSGTGADFYRGMASHAWRELAPGQKFKLACVN